MNDANGHGVNFSVNKPIQSDACGGICNHGINVFVLSDAGKPIFVWHGNDDDNNRTCGLIQAICTSIRHSDLQEEIQTLESGSLVMVFMSVGAITLVAVAKKSRLDDAVSTEWYLRLQLEYIYAQIVMSFTDQIQSIFEQNASFDLRSLLAGTGDAMMRALLQEAFYSDPAPFVVAGVPVCHVPMAARDRASTILQQVGDETTRTFAALLLVGNKLLTIVQSSYLPHQLKSADLNLVLHFVHRQQLNSELWLPLCLPRFNSSGCMHCYVNCLDSTTQLTLVLMSQDGSTEQFQSFRTAGRRIRRSLGIPSEDRTILEILQSSADHTNDTVDKTAEGSDVPWRRNSTSESVEEDYEMVSYFDAALSIAEPQTHLLVALTAALDAALCPTHMAALLHDETMTILHFCFRLNVPIVSENKPKRQHQNGFLTQCLASIPLDDPTRQRHVWNAYERLHLRLRLGAASSGSIHGALQVVNGGEDTSSIPTIGRHCPAMKLSESIPALEGVVYSTLGTETVLGMNGRGFELYLLTSREHPIEKIAASGAKLARRILADEQTLFVSQPRTWGA